MMIFLIIVVSLIIYNIVGHVSAALMANKIAELCSGTEYKANEFEWESNYGDKKWLTENWVMSSTPMGKGKKDKEWQKTGESRGGYVSTFNQTMFKERMIVLRLFWPIALPVNIGSITDHKAITKYDPSISELKIKKLESDIRELEKEAGIDD